MVMSKRFKVQPNCDGVPALVELVKGRNADSMECEVILAVGEEDILNCFGAISGWVMNKSWSITEEGN